MIQETVERLLPIAPAGKFWIITNADLRDPILAINFRNLARSRFSPSQRHATQPRPSDWRRFCWSASIPTR